MFWNMYHRLATHEGWIGKPSEDQQQSRSRGAEA
jgi:hypothetical protein